MVFRPGNNAPVDGLCNRAVHIAILVVMRDILDGLLVAGRVAMCNTKEKSNLYGYMECHVMQAVEASF